MAQNDNSGVNQIDDGLRDSALSALDASIAAARKVVGDDEVYLRLRRAARQIGRRYRSNDDSPVFELQAARFAE